jgi:hypothetical protein
MQRGEFIDAVEFTGMLGGNHFAKIYGTTPRGTSAVRCVACVTDEVEQWTVWR